ncbi:MAG: WbqC family protein [Myxococcota bacterium]
MRLGIMQPYFAPALGYFDLIGLSDRWIVFDTAQYRARSWMNRNRILHPSAGWQYITAHVSRTHLGTAICDVALAEGDGWRTRLLGQLAHYKKHAPFYQRTIALVREVLSAPLGHLARLNVDLLARVCQLLGQPFAPEYFSEMDLDLAPIDHPGDWALRISAALGATEYINPPGGAALFDQAAFAAAGVELRIRHFDEMTYKPRGYAYLPMLSIIDVLMWNPTESIVAHLAEQRQNFIQGER